MRQYTLWRPDEQPEALYVICKLENENNIARSSLHLYSYNVYCWLYIVTIISNNSSDQSYVATTARHWNEETKYKLLLLHKSNNLVLVWTFKCETFKSAWFKPKLTSGSQEISELQVRWNYMSYKYTSR